MSIYFFYNDTATTEIYPLSLHDALPICPQAIGRSRGGLTTKIHALVDALGNPVELMLTPGQAHDLGPVSASTRRDRSEEHTSELQSRSDLVCRLLLVKKRTLNVIRTLDP